MADGSGPSDRADDRRNSFDAVRVAAALCVFFGHQCDLAGLPEPTLGPLGITLSNTGLFVFFAVSGYLVAHSLARDPRPGAFLKARALRIYPGAAANALFCVLLGAAVTTESSGLYWSDGATWAYLAHGAAVLVPPTRFDLPGVFSDARWPSVDTPIWTLKYELLCYLALLSAAAAARVGGVSPVRVLAGAAAAVLCAYLFRISAFPPPAAADFYARLNGFNLLRFGMIFCAGALYAAAGEGRLRSALALIPAALTVAAPSAEVARAGLLLLVVPLAIEIGRSPALFSARYRRFGDLSYGIYLYGYPVQVLSVTRLPGGLGFWPAAAAALAVTALLAALSWTLVERPALRLKRRARAAKNARLVTPADP